MLLAIEQSSAEASVAIWHQDGINQERFSGKRGMSLLSEIEGLVLRLNAQPQDLKGVLVDIGPGSYTGLRIACSAARTLSFALGIPAKGVCGFEAAMADAPQGDDIHFVLDAYRNEVYHACYRRDDAGVHVLHSPSIYSRSEANQIIPKNGFIWGDAGLLEREPSDKARAVHPSASQLIAFVQGLGATFQGENLDGLPEPTPLYLRAAAFRSAKSK